MLGLLTCGLGAALPGGRGGRQSDAALVAAAQRGNVKAFGTLHSRHYTRVYHLAYLKTNNVQDAEDVASETFVRALANLGRVNLRGDDASLYPWLHRIAVNLIVDGHRRRPPSGVVSLDAPTVAGIRALLGAAMMNGGATPHEVAERHEVQQLVRAAIAALPEDQSDVLIYRFLGDLPLREIAPLLNRSEAAAKSLLHRAVVSVRREIEKRVDAVERLELSRRKPAAADKAGSQNAAEETLHAGRS